jgi:hypothetical protein
LQQTKLHFNVWNSYSLLSKSWRCTISGKSTQSLAFISVFAPPYPLFYHIQHNIQLFPSLHPYTWKMKYNKVKNYLKSITLVNHYTWPNKKITIFIVQCCLEVFWIMCRFIDPNNHINIILHPIYITEVTNGVALKNILKNNSTHTLYNVS